MQRPDKQRHANQKQAEIAQNNDQQFKALSSRQKAHNKHKERDNQASQAEVSRNALARHAFCRLHEESIRSRAYQNKAAEEQFFLLSPTATHPVNDSLRQAGRFPSPGGSIGRART